MFFLVQRDLALRKAFTAQAATVIALTKGCKSAQVVEDAAAIPPGCASVVLSPDLSIHLLVRVRNTTYRLDNI